jgi:hypothetical protein
MLLRARRGVPQRLSLPPPRATWCVFVACAHGGPGSLRVHDKSRVQRAIIYERTCMFGPWVQARVVRCYGCRSPTLLACARVPPRPTSVLGVEGATAAAAPPMVTADTLPSALTVTARSWNVFAGYTGLPSVPSAQFTLWLLLLPTHSRSPCTTCACVSVTQREAMRGRAARNQVRKRKQPRRRTQQTQTHADDGARRR